MFWRVEVRDRAQVFDAQGEGLKKDILDLGVGTVSEVRVSSIYSLEGGIFEADIKKIARELLVDNITQEFLVTALKNPLSVIKNPFSSTRIIEVAYNPGVMDPIEESVLKGIRDLGINSAKSVRTAKKYFIKGKLTEAQFKTVTYKLLCNKIIQHVV
ncbi:MAG: phosphoribosylformylglycinamidine synthase subunit PurS, partial [Candidatus Omnitrophota bacterium]|nr:phosphoribosylformylglycinamidine synthase subunit PurS [Candidatus Omnitrophota bacterium]